MATPTENTTTAATAPTPAPADKKMITLESSDGETFEVEESVALQSQTIKHTVKDCAGESAILLLDVTTPILAKVIEYCRMHVEGSDKAVQGGEKAIEKWDGDFLNEIKGDQDVFLDVIDAANYLKIKGLLELTCQALADMIKGKTPEQIRQTLNIENDFTPEEEEAIRRESPWAFEDDVDVD